jgi:hypothetical protein
LISERTDDGRLDMTFHLTQAEKELLRRLLETELEEIRSELHHAQVPDYKEGIREREKLVRELRAKLAP